MIDEAQLVAIHMMAAGGLTHERIADVLKVSVELVQAARKIESERGSHVTDPGIELL